MQKCFMCDEVSVTVIDDCYCCAIHNPAELKRKMKQEKEKKIKKSIRIFTFMIIGFLCFILLWIFWPFYMVRPGYVGVVVDLLGSNQGVEINERHVGVQFIPPWKHIYFFPTFQQNDTWEGNEDFQFQTAEGLAMRADIGISFHLKAESVPMIFQKYRRGMQEISHIFIRNFIRDAINMSASKLKIEDLYGPGKEDFFSEVEKHVKKDLKEIGIEVDRIYLIGSFYFPENVIAALNNKIEATQRAQQRENELREAEAQAKKDVAESQGAAQCIILSANAQATANTTITKSLSPLLIEWEKTKKWDGVLPRVTGSSNPILSVGSLVK
jgi:regulator of protease activity HflC (stomatin/prohibitin superfamily)